MSPETPPQDATDATDASEAADEPVRQFGRVRRAPRYGSWIVTGALAGVVAAVVVVLIVANLKPASDEFTINSVIGYVAAVLGLVGALLGGFVAILLDRRSSRT